MKDIITPKEIQKQCLSWWKSVLVAYIENISFFPKKIYGIGRIATRDLKENLPKILKSYEILRYNSKVNKKNGYSLVEIKRHNKQIGENPFIEKIIIETLEDYLKIVEKEKEYQIFVENYEILINDFPNLKKWIILHPQKLITCKDWPNIIEVCKFFIENPKSDKYIRELPIQVHTKFIENNKGIIRELLDILIKEHIKEQNEKEFEKRFNLKYDQPLIRFRILDENISKRYFSEISYLSIPIDQFEQLKLPIKRVFIVENKMNLLTFPTVDEAIVIFGGGGGVGELKNVKWFKEMELLYWGDLDVHGFEILSQFRSHFSNVKSFLMDEATFKKFEDYKGDGVISENSAILNLTTEERQIYDLLKEKNWRLEQEKIPLEYVKEIIKRH